MSKKPSFSGNIELLKSITEIEQATYTLKEGSNIELEHDANTSTTTINVVNTPNFDDLVVNSVNVLNELNKKYNVVNDVSFADNEINLNLGTINGVQVPIKQDQVANKKYVDEILDNFWEQIKTMNFVNFKGRYNDRLTYGTGDLVAFYENNNWFFYLSIIDLNNEPLTSTKGWIKISSPVPTNLVTVDVLNAEVEKLNNRIDELEKEVDKLSTIKVKESVYWIRDKRFNLVLGKTSFNQFHFISVQIDLSQFKEWKKVVNISLKPNLVEYQYTFSYYRVNNNYLFNLIINRPSSINIFEEIKQNFLVILEYLD